ncbi:ATP-binding cassette domain-containing protein [Candidatus Saccharibacteria bacterium]|nr:ATP-binding cassette domain-containing protein [Candidatus Saccharibacteria bacterium]
MKQRPKIPLKLTNLSKHYGKFRGVENINLELRPGEVFGFLGPNGAGKSTTIRTILNFITPSSGSIKIFELDSSKDSVEVKNYLGYLAGEIALYPEMTGIQILKYLTALGKKTDWEYVDQLTQRLDASLNRPIKSLSKGNVQKIGLIQAFMHKPDLIILDEPTSGLDPLVKQVFYEMVLEMKAQGKTLFISSHDLTEVQKICDRAAFIRQGQLVAIEDINQTNSLNLRHFILKFKKLPPLSGYKQLDGVRSIKKTGNQIELTYRGEIGPLIKLLAQDTPIDIETTETTLEEIFMHYYQEETK